MNGKLLACCSLLIALTIGQPSFAADHRISQKGKAFPDGDISAKVGDTLKFCNDEADITHNVYSLSAGNEFELKTQRPGECSDVVLDPASHSAGVMEVECAIHPNMQLKVNISG